MICNNVNCRGWLICSELCRFCWAAVRLCQEEQLSESRKKYIPINHHILNKYLWIILLTWNWQPQQSPYSWHLLHVACACLAWLMSETHSQTSRQVPSFLPHDSKAIISVGQLTAMSKVVNCMTQLWRYNFPLFCVNIWAVYFGQTCSMKHCKTGKESHTLKPYCLLQGSAKLRAQGCVNAVGKAKQKY